MANSEIKTNLTGKQVSKKMLISTTDNGVKASVLQDISDVDFEKLERRLAIIKANTDITKIKGLKKEDKSGDITNLVNKAKGVSNAKS